MKKWTGMYDKTGRKIYIGSLVYEPSWWWGSGTVEELWENGGQTRRFVIRTADGGLTYNLWNFKEIYITKNPIKERKLTFDWEKK